MNQEKIEELIQDIKCKLAELEIEVKDGADEVPGEKSYKRTRYNVLKGGDLYGGKLGLTKIAVFETIIELEAPYKTLKQLNSIFDKSQFPSLGGFATYDYVVTESSLKMATDDVQRKYSQKLIKTKDKKTVRVSNQWASFENKEKQTPGNFPKLQEIAKTLGYEIIPAK